MKTNKEMLKSGWRGAAAAVALSACLVNFTACNKYDLDVNDPEGWGASLYSYLAEDGHYTNTVRLIDDLGMREVLSKTGSKTMWPTMTLMHAFTRTTSGGCAAMNS